MITIDHAKEAQREPESLRHTNDYAKPNGHGPIQDVLLSVLTRLCFNVLDGTCGKSSDAMETFVRS